MGSGQEQFGSVKTWAVAADRGMLLPPAPGRDGYLPTIEQIEAELQADDAAVGHVPDADANAER